MNLNKYALLITQAEKLKLDLSQAQTAQVLGTVSVRDLIKSAGDLHR